MRTSFIASLIGFLFTGPALAGQDSTSVARPSVILGGDFIGSAGTGVRAVYAPHAGKTITTAHAISFTKCAASYDWNTTTVTYQYQLQHHVAADGTPMSRINSQNVYGQWSGWTGWSTSGSAVNVADIAVSKTTNGGIKFCQNTATTRTVSGGVLGVDDVRWGLN